MLLCYNGFIQCHSWVEVHLVESCKQQITL